MSKKVVLWNPSGDYLNQRPKIYEPIPLLGMRNILESFGYSCDIVDDFHYEFKTDELVRIIAEMNPDVLGISCFGDSDSIRYVSKVYPLIIEGLNNIRNKKPITIFGGHHPTYDPIDIATRYGNPDFIVRGEGEPAIERLALVDFDKDLIKDSRYYDGCDKTWEEISAREGIDSILLDTIGSKFGLDALDFTRPYSLEDYEFVGQIEFQRGCIGKCTFCLEDQYRVRYKSPERLREELTYLINQKGIRVVDPYGPDFTANPDKAAEIIDMMNKSGFSGLDFRPTSRLDTFYTSLKKHREIWSEFIKKNHVSCFIGIESFHPEKLVRLGKYTKNNEFRKRQRKAIQEILGWFPKLEISASWIPFEPETSFMEFAFDLRNAVHLLRRYNGRFVLTRALNRMMIYVPGSAVYEKYVLDQGIKNDEGYIGLYKDETVKDGVTRFIKKDKEIAAEKNSEENLKEHSTLKEVADAQADFLDALVTWDYN